MGDCKVSQGGSEAHVIRRFKTRIVALSPKFKASWSYVRTVYLQELHRGFMQESGAKCLPYYRQVLLAPPVPAANPPLTSSGWPHDLTHDTTTLVFGRPVAWHCQGHSISSAGQGLERGIA